MPDDADEVIMNENPAPEMGSGRVSRPTLTPNAGVPLVPGRSSAARGPAIRQSGANPVAPSPIVGMPDDDVVLPAGESENPGDDMLIMPTGYWPRDQMQVDDLPNTAEVRGDVVVPVNKRRPSAAQRVAGQGAQSAVSAAGSVEAYVGQDFVDRVVESLATLIMEQHAVTDSLKSTQEQLTAIATETKMLAPLAAQAARKADLFEVKGMVQGLTRELKSNFDALMKSVEARIDNLMSRMESVESSLEFYSGLMGQTATKTDLGEISGMASSMSSEVMHMAQNFANISPTMTTLRKEMSTLRASLVDIDQKVTRSFETLNTIRNSGGSARMSAMAPAVGGASGAGSGSGAAPVSDGRSRAISPGLGGGAAASAGTGSGAGAAASSATVAAGPAPALAGGLPKDLAGLKARFEEFQECVKKLGRPIESDEDRAARANEYYDVKELSDALIFACENGDSADHKALGSNVKRSSSGLKFLKKTLGLGASTRTKPIDPGTLTDAPAAETAAPADAGGGGESAPAAAVEPAAPAAVEESAAAVAVVAVAVVAADDNSFDGLKARFAQLQAKVQEVGGLPVPQSPEEKSARFEVVGGFVADAKAILDAAQNHADGRGPALALEVGRVQAGLKILRKRLKG
ncbi:MAG: hypothetical protein ACREJ2_12335 [Planctomycetota bacterium]